MNADSCDFTEVSRKTCPTSVKIAQTEKTEELELRKQDEKPAPLP